MSTDGLIQYLNPQNSNRIANLSITDPFAIAGFIMLALMIPIAMILLTITSRRSADSVWAGIENERRYRLLRRSALMRNWVSSVATSGLEQSHYSTQATIGTPRRVVFSMPPIPESPSNTHPPDTHGPTAPLIPVTPESHVTLQASLFPDAPSPTGTTFSDLYDRWWRAPQIEMEFEDTEGRRRWTTQLVAALVQRA